MNEEKIELLPQEPIGDDQPGLWHYTLLEIYCLRLENPVPDSCPKKIGEHCLGCEFGHYCEVHSLNAMDVFPIWTIIKHFLISRWKLWRGE